MITNHNELKNTARLAGIWYLLMAISGIFGFLIFHSEVYTADPQQTLTNLMESESTARIRLLLEFAIIIFQALTAIWFYKLFRKINQTAALATMVWGTVNSMVIMLSAIAMAVAMSVAASELIVEDKILLVDLLTKMSAKSWSIGSLFFGLWLIPLGFIITSSKGMPLWLGRVLILGGIGYLLNAFFRYGGVSASWVEYLTIPASVAEFWMIGYLLIFGIRPESDSATAE
ncbi:DUF4386 domain-containing protein [uncultured Marivirga sp.]|uniref:DUF4386 domain-containing protein n=1 Tax=uncultured Marivirga sp. TaxID=1123707 RepID=UPI0030EB4BAF|tara:strand:+ start:534664 stop:535353 length:690 start_codon:yes stop_codon:yes gene_type:complete